MDEFAKKPEGADVSEDVRVTQTDGSASCIGEALPLVVNGFFF
jgi:hypothetical protein